MTARHRDGWLALAILCIALGIRLAYVLLANLHDPPVGDGIYYSAQAEVIAAGGGFTAPFGGGPAADHPPMTALILALPSLLPGDNVLEQRLVMAILGVVAVGSIGLLARDLAGARAGLAAAAIAAVYPGLWVNDGLLMSETPTAIATAALLLVTIRWRRGETAAWAVGVVTGLAVMTRAELALLAVLVLTPSILRAPVASIRPRWRSAGAIAGATALVLAPWTVANLIRFEEPVLISTNDGLTLRGANCDNTYGPGLGFWNLDCVPPAAGDQSEVSATYRRQAMAYARDHLDRLPVVVAARLGRVWSLWRPNDMVWLNQGEDREPWASRAALWSYWALAPVSAVGIRALRSRGRPIWPLLATVVAVSATAAAFYGLARFRLPAEVAMVASGGVAVAVGFDRRETVV